LKIGKPLPAIDTIITAIAINNNLKLITKDKHLPAIKEIKKEFNISVE